MLDVYRTYYKMTGEPFRLSPDHRFSLAHNSYANAKAYLQYAIFQGEGFIAVTGGPGTGKTTLISDLVEGLDKEHIEVATLTSTQLESRDLLQMVVNLFDLHPEDKTKAGLLQELERFLNQQSYKGRRVILIVDEAQGLSASALEELRLLANLQRNHQLLLQIFLVGQEQLLEMLRSPGMEHLHQRLIAASHLQPLGLDEVIDYIEHRLSRVGWKGDPTIDEGALRLIHKYSGGIPRRINLICNRLFLSGGLEQKHELVTEDARSVVEELRKEFLLSADAAYENDDEEVAEPDSGTKAPVRSLPRRDMNAAPARTADEPSSNNPYTKARRQATSARPEPDQPRRGFGPAGSKRKAPAQVVPGRVAGRKTRFEPTMRRQPTIGAARPAPAPESAGKSRSWGKMAAFVVLAGFGYMVFYGTGEFGLESVFNDNNEAKPHVAFNTPLDTGAHFQKPEPEPVTPEPVAETVEAASAQTAITEDLSSTEPAAEKDADAETPAEDDDLVSAGGSTDASTPAVLTTLPEPVAAESEKEAVTASEPAEVTKPDDSITVASAQPSKPVETAKREPVKTGTDTLDAEAARLQREAELRLAMNLNQDGSSSKKKVTPAPVKAVPVPKKTVTPPVSSKPRTPPVRVATAPKIKTTPKRSPRELLRAALLEGQWDSRGKPASLLPSKVTYCNSQGRRITCQSVPQDIKTKYGPALYKVETTLKEFSAERTFQLSYRTLVKLLSDDSDKVRKAALSSSTGWQVSEYSMSCHMKWPDQVLCRDKKGVTRDYRRSKSKK